MQSFVIKLFGLFFIFFTINAYADKKTESEIYQEQTKRYNQQLDLSDEQARRYEVLLKRWEEQADRYDKILSAWETQIKIDSERLTQ